jgi:glutaredoxin
MGTVCPKKRGDDPNLVDDPDKSEDLKEPDHSVEEHYDLNYEIKKGVVVIFIDPKYKDCQKVQDLFASINSKPLITDISKDSHPKKLLRSLKKLTGDPAPPYIFITGKYFGGVNEIEIGIKNHTVQKMINAWLDSRVRFGQN